jgi:hypothetical protein
MRGTTAPPVPRPTRSRPTRSRPHWLRIGLIAAILVICGVNFAISRGAGRNAVDGAPVTVLEPPSPRPLAPSPSFSAPVATVDGGPSTSFDLKVGTAVRFTDQDGSWTVALLGVAWIDRCSDSLGGTGPVVAFDIRYEVTAGAVSIIPLTDFTFVLANGAKAKVGLLSKCAAPPLDYTIVSAGQVHRGWIGIELPAGSQGGTLMYGQLVVPTASWTVQR